MGWRGTRGEKDGGGGAGLRVYPEHLKKGTGTEPSGGGRGERAVLRAVPTALAEKGGAAGGGKCACVTRRRRVSSHPLAAASAAASPGPRTRLHRRPWPVLAPRLPRACPAPSTAGRRLPAAACPARSAPSRPRLGCSSLGGGGGRELRAVRPGGQRGRAAAAALLRPGRRGLCLQTLDAGGRCAAEGWRRMEAPPEGVDLVTWRWPRSLPTCSGSVRRPMA